MANEPENQEVLHGLKFPVSYGGPNREEKIFHQPRALSSMYGGNMQVLR
jgi:hypothetical protein